jgi:hypothetical protein
MHAKFLAALISAGTLAVALAPPAVGHDLTATNGCDTEHGWYPVDSSNAPEKDRNGDHVICGKPQQDGGTTFKENHIHTHNQ